MLVYFSIRKVVFLVSILSALSLTGCGGGGGGSANANTNSSGSISISATATTTAQSLTVGRAMVSFSPLTPSGGTAPYTYNVTSGTLPTGLSLSTSTGAVTGTPTTIYATANVVFSVQDAKGVVANTTSTVIFTVGTASSTISATATTTAQSLTVGTTMASFSPLTPSGGTAPYTYTYTGTLPAGLSLDAVTGAVTGTPSATYTTANVVFSVLDANFAAASTTSTVSFTVVAASPTITATATTTAQSLTVGTAMASFSPLTPSGGTAPYTYSILTGSLPQGLTLTGGAVTGTPTAVYTTASVKFQVQDATNTVAATTSTVNFTVGQASNYITATATTTAQSLTVGTTMASFSPLTPSGGTAPYSYIVKSGTLPSGLVLDSVTGAVTGTPAAAQAAARVTFAVVDANLAEASTTSTVIFTVGSVVYSDSLTWMPISSTTYTQPNAATLCAGTISGLTGWRLPTDTELSALYTAYPQSSSVLLGYGWTLGYTWSSTPDVSGGHYSVSLNGGLVQANANTIRNYVTCVR